MFAIRSAQRRGHRDYGWLDTWHTFSFSDYLDRNHMQFRALRVMNEDRVAPGQGFGTHPHRDMEIVTYVLSGALEHRDSMGNGEVLRPGEFQRMTAGTGITHSEFNPSTTEPVHLYQIWLLPESKGLKPSFEQKAFPTAGRANELRLVASPDAAEGSLLIHSTARVYLADIQPDRIVEYRIHDERYAWLQVLRGEILANGHAMSVGDGVAISQERDIKIQGVTDSEVMLFDLA